MLKNRQRKIGHYFNFVAIICGKFILFYHYFYELHELVKELKKCLINLILNNKRKK